MKNNNNEIKTYHFIIIIWGILLFFYYFILPLNEIIDKEYSNSIILCSKLWWYYDWNVWNNCIFKYWNTPFEYKEKRISLRELKNLID